MSTIMRLENQMVSYQTYRPYRTLNHLKQFGAHVKVPMQYSSLQFKIVKVIINVHLYKNYQGPRHNICAYSSWVTYFFQISKNKFQRQSAL